jgi:hypothetical protein
MSGLAVIISTLRGERYIHKVGDNQIDPDNDGTIQKKIE